MGAREYFRHFFGFESFGPVIFLGRQKICPNEHPYPRFYRVPPPLGPDFLEFFFFCKQNPSFLEHISLIIPQEGPLWKQGRICLFNAIAVNFSQGCF